MRPQGGSTSISRGLRQAVPRILRFWAPSPRTTTPWSALAEAAARSSRFVRVTASASGWEDQVLSIRVDGLYTCSNRIQTEPIGSKNYWHQQHECSAFEHREGWGSLHRVAQAQTQGWSSPSYFFFF